MVHTLLLTDLRNFIIEKYIVYTVLLEIRGRAGLKTKK